MKAFASMLANSQAKLNWKPVVVLCLMGAGVGAVLPVVFGWRPEYVPLVSAGLIGLVVVSILLSPPVKKIRFDFFAPYSLFPLMWIATVGLSSLRLTIFQEPWGAAMWLSVGFALLFYLIGIFSVLVLGKRWSVDRCRHKRLCYRWNGKRLWWASLALLLVSIVFLAYEYRLAGSIPLLSSRIELARFDVIAGGYVDTFAMSSRIVVMALGVYLLTKPKIKFRGNLPHFFLIFLSLVLLASTGRRGTFVFPVTVIIIGYHYLRKNFSVRQFALVGLVGFLAIALFSHYRYTATFGVAPLQKAWRPKSFVWLTLGYMTVSDNFRTLHLLTETIPDQAPFQMGRFTTYGIYSVFPGHQENLGEFQNRIWGWEGRYSGSVSTYLGTFYVDWGLVGVIAGSFLMGVLAMFLYSRMLSRPSPYSVLLYSYMAYCLMFTTFSNPFTWTLTYWDVIAFALVNVYAKKRTVTVLKQDFASVLTV